MCNNLLGEVFPTLSSNEITLSFSLHMSSHFVPGLNKDTIFGVIYTSIRGVETPRPASQTREGLIYRDFWTSRDDERLSDPVHPSILPRTFPQGGRLPWSNGGVFLCVSAVGRCYNRKDPRIVTLHLLHRPKKKDTSTNGRDVSGTRLKIGTVSSSTVSRLHSNSLVLSEGKKKGRTGRRKETLHK